MKKIRRGLSDREVITIKDLIPWIAIPFMIFGVVLVILNLAAPGWYTQEQHFYEIPRGATSWYIVGPNYKPVIIFVEKPSDPTQEELEEEIFYDQLGMLAQLVEAEAGNQDLDGKRLVADVVFNRKDSDLFPNTIEEVIFQTGPVQFSSTVDGNYEKAGWNISEDSFLAVSMELEDRMEPDILYFATKKVNGVRHFRHGDHWFSY